MVAFAILNSGILFDAKFPTTRAIGFASSSADSRACAIGLKPLLRSNIDVASVHVILGDIETGEDIVLYFLPFETVLLLLLREFM